MKWLRNWIKEEIRSQFSIAYSESVVEDLKERIRVLERRQNELRVDVHQIAESTTHKIVSTEKFLDETVARLLKKQL